MKTVDGRERPAERRVQRPFLLSQRLALQLDRAVAAAIALLIFVTPLFADADEPWRFTFLEMLCFLLAALWAMRALLTPQKVGANRRTACRCGLPLMLFAVIVAAQLISLPPPLLRLSSPSTYRVYEQSLAGWPQRIPYRDLTAGAANHGASAQQPERKTQKSKEVSVANSLRRSISLAPGVTRRTALKFLAFAALFFLVAFYPFGFIQRQEDLVSWCRRAVIAVLTIGMVIGIVGLLQRSTDDDRSLWLFLAHDPRFDFSSFRASAFFENPDHFANYLDLILPFAIAGFLFPRALSWRRYELACRCLCGFLTLVLIAGLIASASRAGWIAGMLSLICLIWLARYIPVRQRPALLTLHGRWRLLAPVVAAGALLTALAIAGPFARSQADSRISPTQARDDLTYRLEAAKDSLKMVRDFPVLGVGLGCWAELFPRYCRPPWSAVWWAETHNDYVQTMAETGIAGFLCMAWFFWRVGREVYLRRPPANSAIFPIFAAIIAAIAAGAYHEFFDFSFHTPANAFLFTLWVALGLRIAIGADSRSVVQRSARWNSRWLFAGAAAGALILMFAALTQGDEPFFPYEVDRLETPADVRAFMLAHPGDSRAHLILLRMMAGRWTPDEMDDEAERALWLEPTNPLARDIHARVLLGRNQRELGLGEITRSIFYSPTPASHFYLTADRAIGLARDERAAVEQGFRMAVEQHFPDAVFGLGDYYQSLGEPSKEAESYMAGAAQESDTYLGAQYLLRAGNAYLRARQWSNAEKALSKAIQLEPDSSAPYQALVMAYASSKQIVEARTVIKGAREQGVEVFPLYTALAQVQMNSGDSAGAIDSLLKAARRHPDDFMTLYNLGQLFIQRQQYDRAVMWLKRAAAVNPRSVDTLCALAGAQQSSYDFFDAERTYKKALTLDPHNGAIRRAYEELERRVQQAEAERQKLQ